MQELLDLSVTNYGIFVVVVVGGFIIVVLFLWLILPFAVFEIKDKIKKLEKNSEAMSRQIEEANETLRKINANIGKLVNQGTKPG